MSFKFSFSNVRKLISSGLDECPIASVKATRPELPTLTLSPCDTRFCLFSLAPHIQLLTQKKKKHDLGPGSFLFKLLDGADGVYGWLHPEVSDRRDTPKDNERNDHREKSDDESELRLGMQQ